MNGKGGTGKTTIAALLVAYLAADKHASILAIDADPNSCFAEALGVVSPQTIVGVCDEVSKNMDKMPSGMTKDRYIELRVQESIAEEPGFDLLVMGRPEGPGCYCYVNSLLRGIIGRITKSYDYTVIDNAAGMEHISRRTMSAIDKLMLVSDYSVSGIRSTRRILDLANEMKIKIGGAWLIVNKVDGPLSALKDEIAKTRIEMAGELPYSDALVRWNISGGPTLGFGGRDIKDRMGCIFGRMTEKKDGDRACKRKI